MAEMAEQVNAQSAKTAMDAAAADFGLAQAKVLMQKCIDDPGCHMTATQLKLVEASLLFDLFRLRQLV